MANSIEYNANFLKKFLKKFLSLLGYEVKRINNFMDRNYDQVVELNDEESLQIHKFEKICLASKANLWSILQSIKHIKNNNIEGDVVECGIYNGFTLSFIGKFLSIYEINKKIWGYDTFEDGFLKNNISEFDLDYKTKKNVDLKKDKTKYFSMKDVISNINQNHIFNLEKYNLIKGDIIKSLDIPENIPNKISFLRMDTDIYKTTAKQLDILYPKLSIGGVLHIDDYGLCAGVRKAVDEYFKGQDIWLHRVDLTCRYLIKTK
tara:strand:+ start:812 stop:1597 length:786 start_codon:yes stop_codon:yes gene_type:complete